MTEGRRRPLHLVVLFGASAGAYAVSLAGVTAQQSQADAVVIAQRAPVAAAIDQAAAAHRALEGDLTTATRRYRDLAAGYARVVGELEGMERATDAVVVRAARVADAAGSMPTRVALPAVPAAPRAAVPAPVTHATTGGSG
jgi:hypothetical protein